MELLCERCKRLVEEDVCPFCGGAAVREPADGDECWMTELDWTRTAAFSDLLNRNGIPFRAYIGTPGGKYHGPTRVFYVPYGRLEDAWAELEKLSAILDGAPAAEDTEAEIFEGDEIDRMEAAALDELNPEELEAYSKKITRTLKWIKAQEQAWKERTNRLRDMKEEIEYLMDE